jgi:hypothetical protein
MDNWGKIKQYLLNDEDCTNIHKFIWDDHAVITDKGGKRYKIDGNQNLNELKRFVRMLINERCKTRT